MEATGHQFCVLGHPATSILPLQLDADRNSKSATCYHPRRHFRSFKRLDAFKIRKIEFLNQIMISIIVDPIVALT